MSLDEWSPIRVGFGLCGGQNPAYRPSGHYYRGELAPRCRFDLQVRLIVFVSGRCNYKGEKHVVG